MQPSSTIDEDSPPYTPTALVELPTDPEKFLAEYTYQDDPLPVPIAMGYPPEENGLGPAQLDIVKTCLVVPGETTFQLLEPKDSIPLVIRSDGGLGPVPELKSEAEFLAMGPAENIRFPSFSLVSTSTGLFDIVTKDSPRRYIAKKSDGSVVLTDQSTNDAQMTTSIFDVTCEGRITVRVESQHYNWFVRNNELVMETANGTPGTMYTLADTVMKKRARRNQWQDGVAPRCASAPRPLMAKVFDGARGFNPNQCGSSSFNVPDLSFGTCCDRHDNDFDSCEKTFEEGNNNFRSCMRGQGCDHLNRWYSWPVYLGCLRAAEFYYSVVSGYFGQQAFYSANKDRCRCFCEDSEAGICNNNGQPQCRRLFGTDVNNCGACDRKCPEGGRCAGGRCRCAADQCGNRCVTLASHPKNCGICGRVSPTGYCVGGQPYSPPAFCSRGNGFRNGNFKDGKTDWSTFSGGAPNDALTVGNDAAAQDADMNSGLVSTQGGVDLRTRVKMCPGTAYKLSFQQRRVGGSFLRPCFYYVSLAGVQKASGLIVPPVTTPWMTVSDISAGPFGGEGPGVSAVGPELWVDFELKFVCQSGSTAVRVDQFSIVPV
ncbi:hypothetical protein ACN47E_007185 [Coniothyrium glycines]